MDLKIIKKLNIFFVFSSIINDPHARTLSANRVEDYSYYMHESTPRLDEHQLQQHQQQFQQQSFPNESQTDIDQRSRNGSKLKKSNSLRANSYFSKFDELIKNTCDLVVQPAFETVESVCSSSYNFNCGSRYANDFADDLNAYELNQRRYLRANYDKSLSMYSEELAQMTQNKNEPEDENYAIENMIKTMNTNSNNDSNCSRNTAQTVINVNTSNNEAHNINNNNNNNSYTEIKSKESSTPRAEVADDVSTSTSFFDVSKKVESHSNISVDSTLEVDLDYLNESFII